jgi:hypothetical protein
MLVGQRFGVNNVDTRNLTVQLTPLCGATS